MPARNQAVRAGLGAGSTEPGQTQEAAATRISEQITGRWESSTARVCARRSRLPGGPPPVTPQSYRAHLHATRALETTRDPDRKAELEKVLLSKEQQTALARIKRYTDFNDVATQSRLGRAEVERQVRTTVNKAFAEAQQKEQQRRQQTQQQRRTRRAAHI